MHETHGTGKQRNLTFFVQSPPGDVVRGERALIGANLFAVSKGVTVTFDPKER